MWQGDLSPEGAMLSQPLGTPDSRNAEGGWHLGRIAAF